MTKYIDRYYLNGELYGIKFGNPLPIPTDGLLAYYKLESDTKDYSGNGNDATWVGTANYTTEGGVTSANFAGSDYISTPIVVGNGPFTILCAYNHNSNASGYETIFGAPLAYTGSSVPYLGWLFYNNHIFAKAGYYSQDERTAPTIAFGERHFVALRIDSNGAIKMNYDTNQDTSTTNAYNITEGVYIGAGVGNKFNGNICKLAIYNKALTDSEVEECRQIIMA